MKSFNKRLIKRKASKVSLKAHRKDSHPSVRDMVKREESGGGEARTDQIKFH